MNKRPALLSVIGFTFVLLALLSISFTAQATPSAKAPAQPQALLLAEDFDYGLVTGNLTVTSGGNWVAHSGAGVGPVQYIPTSLSMAGYGSSGVGGAATIATGSTEDVNRSFITQTTGTLYFAALVNVSTAGTGDYFLHFKDSGNNFRARVYAKNDVGVLRFGLSVTGTIITYAPAAFITNTTYLVVAKYNVDTGDSTLYVLDAFSASEPITSAVAFTSTTGPTATVQAIAIRQGGTNLRPAATIDGIRVANTWADVVGYVPPVEADPSIAKSGPATASAGDPIAYTINLSNTGNTTATTTIVTDTLPAEVDFITYTTALTVNFSRSGQTLVWDLGDVAGGASNLQITVQGTISASLGSGTVFTNTVTGSTTATETTTANNTASAATLIGAPDLVVLKTGPATANAGDLAAYTLTYSNTGDLNATGVVLVDQLPAGLTYVGDSLGGGVQVGGRITWTFGSLATNTSGSLVLTATAVYVGDQVNVATISGSPTDSNPLDNVAVFTTTVLGSDPFVTKTGPAVAFSGELITYTVVYGNHGNAATNVTLTDTLPISFTTSNIASDTSGLTPIDSANTRSWTRTLAAGDRFTFTLALTVPTAIANNTRITNTIQIAGSGLGNNPIDDLSSASSTVYQIVPISTARAGVNGQVFAVEGQVIVVPATYSAGEWELQDDTGGITAFYTPAPTIALGDHVRLVGVFDNSFGAQPELSSPRYFANLGPGIPPAPKLYTTGQVVAGSSQGWLVTISGTLSSLTTCSGNYHLAVNDSSGAADVFINAYSNPIINPCGRGFANGDWVQVTGFSTVFSPTYEVRPRMVSDLVQYPRVLSVSPANGAIEVPLAATLTATFNTTMTNVSGATFLLQGPGGAVAGTVAYNPATKAAVFTPTAALTSNALYTATLKAALMADNGLTLMPAQDYVWTFTTHRPTADLSTSTKGNSVNDAVHAGQWVTYTITLNNTGDGNATAVVTDVLSSYYSVAKALDFTQPTTGTLTWTGVVTAGQSVNLQFVAQVKGPQYLPLGGSLLLNSAQVSEGSHLPVTLDDPMPPTITIYGVYLPLIKR